MTTRDTPFAPGTPCWVDISSSDMEASKAFYTSLFGWTAATAAEEYGGYIVYSSDGHTVAGQAPKMAGMEGPDFWSTYIATADVEATVSTATEAGASLVAPRMVVGEMGTMAVLTDPAGAAFGLWQAGSHTGFEKYNEPGSVTWDELNSKDYAAAKAFYTKVFGWELESVSDTEEFRYATGAVDGSAVAALMDSSAFLPAEVPSHWAVYFSVADADRAVAKIVELGGAVVTPAADSPFGRMAEVTDAGGAAFKLHQVLPEGGS